MWAWPRRDEISHMQKWRKSKMREREECFGAIYSLTLETLYNLIYNAPLEAVSARSDGVGSSSAHIPKPHNQFFSVARWPHIICLLD